MKTEEVYSICDIETNTIKSKPDPELDELRYVGFRHGGRNTCLHYSEHDEIQKIISYFPYIVGHRFKEYDKVVLERYGYHFRRDQVIVDTYTIVDNRFKSMLYMDINSGDRSLKSLAQRLKFNHLKTEFDYSLLKEEVLTGENYKLLETYLFNDLEVTDELFLYCYNLFEGFKEYMSEENRARMCWLINPPGSTAYKCICHLAGLPEEYADVEGKNKAYQGGFVSMPYVDFVEG